MRFSVFYVAASSEFREGTWAIYRQMFRTRIPYFFLLELF